MFSENLYVPFTLFSGSYVFKKARYSAGYSSSASLCGDVLSREAEVCSYRQLGSASASPPSPMVFLVLEENVHSLRDVTLLLRHWNINSDANWKRFMSYEMKLFAILE